MKILPRKCAVNGCPATSKDKSMYDFPKTVRLLEAWAEFCDRGRYWKPSKNSQLCSNHFTPSDIQTSTSVRGRTLRMNACPSIKLAPKSRLLSCAVASCKNNAKVSSDDVSYHMFPTDTDERRKWVEFCGKNANWDPGRSYRVCSEHFRSEEMESSFIRNKAVRKLKDGVYPTINGPVKKSPEKKQLDEQQEIKLESPDDDDDDESYKIDSPIKSPEARRSTPYQSNITAAKTTKLIRRSFMSPLETITCSEEDFNTKTSKATKRDDDIVLHSEGLQLQHANVSSAETGELQPMFSYGSRDKFTDQHERGINENDEQGKDNLNAAFPTTTQKPLNQTSYAVESENIVEGNQAQVVDSEGLLEVMEKRPNRRRRTISSYNNTGNSATKKSALRSNKKELPKRMELSLPDIRRSFKRQSLPSEKQLQLFNTRNKSTRRDQEIFGRSRGVSLGRNANPLPKLFDNAVFAKGAATALSEKMSSQREKSKRSRDGNHETLKDIQSGRNGNPKQIEKTTESSSFAKAGSHLDKSFGSVHSNKGSHDTTKSKKTTDSLASRKTPRKSFFDDKPSERNDEIILEISTSNSHTAGKSSYTSKTVSSSKDKSVVTEQKHLLKLPSRGYNSSDSRNMDAYGKTGVHESRDETFNATIASSNTQASDRKFIEPFSKHQERRMVNSEGFIDSEELTSGRIIGSNNSQATTPVKMLTFLDEDQTGSEIFIHNNPSLAVNFVEQSRNDAENSDLYASVPTFVEEKVSKVIEVSLHNKKIKKKIKVTLSRKNESSSGSTETLNKSETLTTNSANRLSTAYNDKMQKNERKTMPSNNHASLGSAGDGIERENAKPHSIDTCELSPNIQEFINGTEIPRETILELSLANQEGRESSGQISPHVGETTQHNISSLEENAAKTACPSEKPREKDEYEVKRQESREHFNVLLSETGDVDTTVGKSELALNNKPETSLERSYSKQNSKRSKGIKSKSHEKNKQKQILRNSPKKIENQSKIYVKFSPESRKSKKLGKNTISKDTEQLKSVLDVRRRLSAKYVGRNDELLKSVATKITKSRLNKTTSPKSRAIERPKPNNENNEQSFADSCDKTENASIEKRSTKVVKVTLPSKDNTSKTKVKVTLNQTPSQDNKPTKNIDEVSFTERLKPASKNAKARSAGKKRPIELEDASLPEENKKSTKRTKVSVSSKRKTLEAFRTSPMKSDSLKLYRAPTSEPELDTRYSPVSEVCSNSETVSAVSPSLLQEYHEINHELSENVDFAKRSNKSSNSSYSLPEWQMCEVTRCRNNSLKAISGVVFHPLPLNLEKRNKWMEFCKPGDDWKPQEFSRVCSKHFKPEDYVNVKLHNHVKKVLKLVAIPSIYPGEIQSTSSTGHKELDNSSTLFDKNPIKEEPNVEEPADDRLPKNLEEPNVDVVKDKTTNEPIEDDSGSGSEMSRISGASYMVKSDNFSASSLSTEDSNYSSSGSSKLRKKVDEQKTLISTLYAAQNELKRKVQKQSVSIKKLQKRNATTEQSKKELVKKINEMKYSLKNQSSDPFSLSKQAFRSKLIDSPIGSALTENQIDLLLQVKKKVHWTSAELFGAFTIRCLSKEDYVYEYLKSTYPMPDISALQRYAQKVTLYGGLLNDVLDIMVIMGKMLSDKDRATVLIYDSIPVQSTLEYDPDGDEIVGPCNSVHILMARGLFSDWKQPIFVDFDKNLAVSMLNKVISKLHDIQFNVVALVCDSSQPKLNLLLGLGVSGKTTYFNHPRTDKKICCFFDPPRLLEMTRKALVTKGFTYTDGTEMTKEPLSRLRNSGPYIFPDGSLYTAENMLDWVNPDMESLSSAIELFSVTISSLLRKAMDTDSLVLASFIETVNKWFEIMSSLYLSGNEQLIVYFKDTDDQNAILNRTYDLIKSLRCIETNRINIFQEAILISIRSLQVLSKEMMEVYDEDTIFANKLSQNAMDILFDNIKMSCDEVLTPINVLDKMRSIIFGTCEEVVKSESTLLLAEERFLTVMAFEEADLEAIVREKTLDDIFFIKSKSSAWDNVVREIEDDGKLDVLTDFLIKKHRKQFCSIMDKVPPKYSMRANSHGAATTAINFSSYSTQMKSICTTLETFFKNSNKDGTLSYKTKVLDNLVNQTKGQVNIHKEIVKSFLLQRILIRLRYLVLDMNIESGSCSDSDSF